MSRFGPIVLLLLFSLPAHAVTFQSIQSESFVNRNAGPDLMWGTPDDTAVPGFNSGGHANFSITFDSLGAVVAGGAGQVVFDYPDFDAIVVPSAPVTNFSIVTTDVDAGVITSNDPSITPHVQTWTGPNTSDLQYTAVSCIGAAGCADPLVSVSLDIEVLSWTAAEDPTTIDALTMSEHGDLSAYALFLESEAPDNASAFAIGLGYFELTPDNVSGLLVTDEWFGGAQFFSTATYSTDPIPEPTTALLMGLGLIGLAARRRVH